MNIKSIKLYRVTFLTKRYTLYCTLYDTLNGTMHAVRYAIRNDARYDTHNKTIYHSRRMTVPLKRISYGKWYSVSFMVYRASCVYRACSVRISFV